MKFKSAGLLGLFALSLSNALASNPERAISQSFMQQEEGKPDYDKNVIKMNLAALAVNSYSFQYERMLTSRVSLTLGYAHMPTGKFPHLDRFENMIDDPVAFSHLKDVRLGNTMITPAARFYLGKKDGPRGFYISPFVRFSNYDLGVPNFQFDIPNEEGGYDTRTLALAGNIRGTTGGVLFGAQWRLAQWVYLDWWILGGSYGKARGDINGQIALNAQEQQELREALENEFEIPFVDTEVTVDGQGARLKVNGPWGGVRTGLAIGIKF